jgi:hypothetical protein
MIVRPSQIPLVPGDLAFCTLRWTNAVICLAAGEG